MKDRKPILLVIAAALFVSMTIGVAMCEQGVAHREKLYEQIELFSDVVSIVKAEYVDEVPPKDLIYGALKGMLASLDSHSQFMDPDTYNEIKVETEGQFGGLGIEISIRDGLLTIISPIDGTPAYNAGVKAGDRIVKIDGESTKDITLLDAVKKLRGKPGTEVTITVLREKTRKLFDITITRDIIKIESIKKARIIEDKIGYIRLVEFKENSPKDLDAAIKELEEKGMDSLILDLRNNPGGLLNVAVEISDKFLPEGVMVVSTKGRRKGQSVEFKSRRRPYPDYPMVVMINEGSASASEILAGALQDHKRAIILGTTSFGKGSVQTVIPLRDGSAARLTTAKYFTPSDRSINNVGIVPDVVVELKEVPKEAKAEAEDIFEQIAEKENGAEEKEAGVKEKEDVEGEEPEVDSSKEGEIELEKEVYDNQLSRAIDLLKGIKVYLSRN